METPKRTKRGGTPGNKGGCGGIGMTKYAPEFCSMLLRHMAEGLSFESFAGVCLITKSTLYAWRDAHPEFCIAKEVGTEAQRLYWEELNRGIARGEIEGNTTAVIWAMRNQLRWSNNETLKVVGDKDEAPVSIRSMSRTETEQRYKELEAKIIAAHHQQDA